MSLIKIEISSKKLQDTFKYPASNKYKLIAAIDFFKQIEKRNQTKFVSFFEQFHIKIIELILSLESSNGDFYFSPDELDSIDELILRFFELKILNNQNEFSKLRNILTNQRERINDLLSGKNNKGNNKKSINSISIILLENVDHQKEELSTGHIYKLRLSSSSLPKKEHIDNIQFKNLVEKYNPEIQKHLNDCVATAKAELEKIKIKIHHYNFNYYFEKDEFIYQGTSLGIAGIALAYNMILANEQTKFYHKFREDVVFTGKVDTDGKLLKIEKEILHKKLNTVFFSEYKKFVIPDDNYQEAKEHLASLNTKYPDRELELIPIKKFTAIFKNLDIVEVCRLKLTEKLKADYHRYHKVANLSLSLILIFILAFILIDKIIPYLDRNPVRIELKVDRYVALNKYGKEVWSSDLFVYNEIVSAEKNKEYFMRRIFLVDMDYDKSNEIIMLKNGGDDLDKKTVFCYKNNKELIWKTIIPPKDSLYGKDICNNDISNNSLFIFENRRTKKIEIIVVSNVCALYPRYLTKLNSEGKIISVFYNSGVIDEFVSEIDADNKSQNIIFGGINNDLGYTACISVFDPDYITGSAPGYRLPGNIKKGLMKYYIKFPKTELANFTADTYTYASTYFKNDKTIPIIVSENLNSKNEFPKTMENSDWGIVYEFDKNFNIINVMLSAFFEAMYNQKMKEGKVRYYSDLRQLEDSLKSEVRWWDGEKFVNYATMNKNYLLAKDSVDQCKKSENKR